jgi:hypothetical protein
MTGLDLSVWRHAGAVTENLRAMRRSRPRPGMSNYNRFISSSSRRAIGR